MNRYIVTTSSGEIITVYHVIDTEQPETEQPAIVLTFDTRTEPRARFLAEDFAHRHNAK